MLDIVIPIELPRPTPMFVIEGGNVIAFELDRSFSDNFRFCQAIELAKDSVAWPNANPVPPVIPLNTADSSTPLSAHSPSTRFLPMVEVAPIAELPIAPGILVFQRAGEDFRPGALIMQHCRFLSNKRWDLGRILFNNIEYLRCDPIVFL